MSVITAYGLSVMAVGAIGALQRFAVGYGYQGLSKGDALRSAGSAFGGVIILGAVLAIIR